MYLIYWPLCVSLFDSSYFPPSKAGGSDVRFAVTRRDNSVFPPPPPQHLQLRHGRIAWRRCLYNVSTSRRLLLLLFNAILLAFSVIKTSFDGCWVIKVPRWIIFDAKKFRFAFGKGGEEVKGGKARIHKLKPVKGLTNERLNRRRNPLDARRRRRRRERLISEIFL